MKKTKIFYFIFLALIAISCDSYLDEMPDNRATVDSKTKIRKLLTSAYPEGSYNLVTEISSDNVDDMGANNPYSSRFYEQLAYWQDVNEADNDDPKQIWQSSYEAIAHANEALHAISMLEGSEDLSAEKGEALISRAYNHFVLVNVFCKHYSKTGSTSDLGIPYMEKSETELNPQYQRGSVEEVYKKINIDIEAALPLINDEIYDIDAYHFTKKAAYAFAARFNLYYENWEKAKEYASLVVGDNPSALLRDWSRLGSLPKDESVVSNAFVNDPSNLLCLTDASIMGVYFGGYYEGGRLNHTSIIAETETINVPQVCSASPSYRFPAFVYNASNLNKTIFYKIPYMFETTDPVAGIGYHRTVTVPLTTDETLLVRAEAEIMLGQYEAAVNDINAWTANFFKNANNVTVEEVNKFYTELEYSTETVRTQKKTLHPSFTVETGVQENMIHYVLQCRRLLTLHEGMRWFDVKRYGIEIIRYQLQPDGYFTIADVLKTNDLRRAIQIPLDVVSAGLTPNPR